MLRLISLTAALAAGATACASADPELERAAAWRACLENPGEGGCLAALDPRLNEEDRAFDIGLRQLSTRPLGSVPAAERPDALRQLFGLNVAHVCVIYGGDWVQGVREQWQALPNPPAPTANLRNLGANSLDLDGMVALVGVDQSGDAHVRRGFWGDGNCSDYAEPQCFGTSSLSLEIVAGQTLDGGPEAGRPRKALRLRDPTGAAASCPLETYRSEAQPR